MPNYDEAGILNCGEFHTLKPAQGSTVAGAAHRPRNFLQNLQTITWPISPFESPNRDFLRN